MREFFVRLGLVALSVVVAVGAIEILLRLTYDVEDLYAVFQLKPEIAEVESMRAALQFETQTFMSSSIKDQYVSNIKQKLIVMTTARQQQLQQRMQGGVPNNMNNPMNGMNPQTAQA